MTNGMSKQQFKAWLEARHEALEMVRAQELAAMTEEDARRIMLSLKSAGTPWREREDWSGLVEQQRRFARVRKA